MLDIDNQKSKMCADDTFSLFDTKPVQVVMLGYKVIKIQPVNMDSITNSNTIEFDFPVMSTSTYYDLTETFLNLEFETKKNNTAAVFGGGGVFINMPVATFLMMSD